MIMIRLHIHVCCVISIGHDSTHVSCPINMTWLEICVSCKQHNTTQIDTKNILKKYYLISFWKEPFLIELFLIRLVFFSNETLWKHAYIKIVKSKIKKNLTFFLLSYDQKNKPRHFFYQKKFFCNHVQQKVALN